MAAGAPSAGAGHEPLSSKYMLMLTAPSLKGVHLALQMASTCGAQWPPAQGRQVVAVRRRRNMDRITIVDQQRLARSIFASHRPCANTESPFGSWSQEYGVGGRWPWRGVGRPCETRRRVEFSSFRSFLSVLYSASGYFFSGSGVTLSYTEDSAPNLYMIQWPTSIPFLFQFTQAACSHTHLQRDGSWIWLVLAHPI